MPLVEFISFLRSIDWGAAADFATVVTAAFILWQLCEMRRATHAQAYSVAVERLQDEKVRKARRLVFQLKEKSFQEWTREERDAAEVVCHSYDSVGQMVRHHLLRKDIIIDSWGPSLRNSWPILKPLIEQYRNDFAAPEYWDDYEWLANEAEKAANRQGRTRKSRRES